MHENWESVLSGYWGRTPHMMPCRAFLWEGRVAMFTSYHSACSHCSWNSASIPLCDSHLLIEEAGFPISPIENHPYSNVKWVSLHLSREHLGFCTYTCRDLIFSEYTIITQVYHRSICMLIFLSFLSNGKKKLYFHLLLAWLLGNLLLKYLSEWRIGDLLNKWII